MGNNAAQPHRFRDSHSGKKHVCIENRPLRDALSGGRGRHQLHRRSGTAGVTIFGGSEDKQQVQLPDFVKLVEDNGPGVVNIQMIRNARTVENAGIPGLDPRGAEIFRRFGIPFDFGPQEIPEQRGTGSGFIVSSDASS